jgi:hypothetical protein
MATIYEIYYENRDCDVVWCSDHITSEHEATEEIRKLGIEFPQNEYWWEATYEDEQ